MRVNVRETGSIRVRARETDVLEVLTRSLRGAAVTSPGRLEVPGSTYIVRADGNGTHVIHARTGTTGLARAVRDREEMRRSVQSDLFELQRLLDQGPK